MITGGSAPLRRRHTRKAYHLGRDELNCGVMRARSFPTSRAAGAVAGLGLLLVFSVGCAHKPGPAPEGPTRALVSEAGRIGRISYEDDFTEARLRFSAFAPGGPRRTAPRPQTVEL